MSSTVTLTITKNDNSTVSAHLAGVISGSLQVMEAEVPRELQNTLSEALVTIWACIHKGMEVDRMNCLERN